MDDPEILALYEWAPGTCFRCARAGLDTIHIKEIPTPVGVLYEVRACRGCVLALEGERRVHAEQAGEDYQPGGLSA
jgi:hypothetical protein